jgi:uncharacterized membrane protein
MAAACHHPRRREENLKFERNKRELAFPYCSPETGIPPVLNPTEYGVCIMNSDQIIRGAIAGMLALGIAGATSQAMAAAGSNEKCAGIAKAGKNDCGTSKSSCAATAKMDRDAEAWILVPTGTCEKISGGRLQTSEFAKPGGKSGELSPAAKAAHPA